MEISKPIKLDVFGKQVLAIRTENNWRLYYVSGDGKRRVAADLFVPPFVKGMEVERYLADICHEWATEDHPEVLRLE
jgi:hypothetical protein